MSCEKLPFESSSISVFYCSHVIEHLPDNIIEFLLKEIFRCLKPGGLVRFTCPDISLIYQAFKDKDERFWFGLDPWRLRNKELARKFVEHFATGVCNKNKFPELFISVKEIEQLFDLNPRDKFFDLIIAKLPKDINSDYPEGHINWFTVDKLIRMMRQSGLLSAVESRYLQSSNPVLQDPRFFDSTSPELSLYVEAKKPY